MEQLRRSEVDPRAGGSAMLEYITKHFWLLEETTLSRMVAVFERHFAGERLSDETIERIVAARDNKSRQRSYNLSSQGVAVIPVSGIIAKHSYQVNDVSQPRGTSIDVLRMQLDEAIADRAVRSILLHIESPGGFSDGVADLGDEIFRANATKPVIGYADDLAASGAYWLGSQTQRFFANQTAEVGSIGVYSIFLDSSERAGQLGYKFHIVRTGPNKGVHTPGIESTEENLAAEQEVIDCLFEVFLTAILRGRSRAGLEEALLRKLADGRTYIANVALAAGLIDEIGTFEAALAYAGRAEISDTAAAADASAEKQSNKNEKLGDSIMAEKEGKPDAAEEILRTEATAAERQRITAISEALGDERFAKLRDAAIAAGKTPTEARAMAFDESLKILAADKKEMQTQLDSANEKLKAIAAGGVEVGAQATSEEGEGKTDGSEDDGKAETYAARVKQLQGEGKSKAQAYRRAAGELPKSHAAWKKADKKSL